MKKVALMCLSMIFSSQVGTAEAAVASAAGPNGVKNGIPKLSSMAPFTATFFPTIYTLGTVQEDRHGTIIPDTKTISYTVPDSALAQVPYDGLPISYIDVEEAEYTMQVAGFVKDSVGNVNTQPLTATVVLFFGKVEENTFTQYSTSGYSFTQKNVTGTFGPFRVPWIPLGRPLYTGAILTAFASVDLKSADQTQETFATTATAIQISGYSCPTVNQTGSSTIIEPPSLAYYPPANAASLDIRNLWQLSPESGSVCKVPYYQCYYSMNYAKFQQTLVPDSRTIMASGSSLYSLNKRYQLTMQADCNLVLSDTSSTPSIVLWTSQTAGQSTGCTVLVDTDGLHVLSGKGDSLFTTMGMPGYLPNTMPRLFNVKDNVVFTITNNGTLVGSQCGSVFFTSNNTASGTPGTIPNTAAKGLTAMSVIISCIYYSITLVAIATYARWA